MSLEAEHSPEEIRRRLEAKKRHSYLGDAILGAIDGCVTTFAVVAGAMGGKLSAGVALLLGTSNLLADGFSMAVGNFQRAKSEQELLQKIRKTEERHVAQIPEGEREEIRQIFAQKGFKEPVLSEIVLGITKDKKLWVDTMLIEEYGLELEKQSPTKTGLVTFLAFLSVGAVPLFPFCSSIFFNTEQMYSGSILATALAFFGIGALKGNIVRRPIFWSGFETLLIGSIAALLAYFVGFLLRGYISF